MSDCFLRKVTQQSIFILLGFMMGCGGGGATGFAPVPLPPPKPAAEQLAVSVAGGGSGAVASQPAGIVCPPNCTANFQQGTKLTLSAVPQTGSDFTGWTGNCSGNSSECILTLDSRAKVTASFVLTAKKRVQLTIAFAGTGSGTVLSNPASIACPSTCAATFQDGDTVDLSAAAQAGSQFTGWSGSCSGSNSECVLTLHSDVTVTAAFAVTKTVQLTTALTGTGNGTVSSNPAGITCPSTCVATFQDGDTVDLSASAQTGSQFSGWSGNCSGTSDCVLTLHDNTQVTATFAATSPGLKSINHIIFTFQENRSLDNYFGQMPQYRAMKGLNEPFNGLPANVVLFDLAGKLIAPYHLKTVCVENTQPSWNATHVDWNQGQMNQFPLTGNWFGSPSVIDPDEIGRAHV